MIPKKHWHFVRKKKTLLLPFIIGLFITLVVLIHSYSIWIKKGHYSNGSVAQENVKQNNPQLMMDNGAQLLPDESSVDNQIDGSLGVMNTKMVLDNAIIPMNDRTVLASKYRNIRNIPIKLTEPPIMIENGMAKKFWVLNVDQNKYNRINATLVYQTPHVYFWVEEGVHFNFSDLKKIVDNFEDNIYPKNRKIFGNEWYPGVDNNPHLAILYANHLGGAAGYYSASDSLMQEIDKYSNLAEMFYLSADYVDLEEEYASSVLAHEFQHMIHWNIDRNESSWINEGLSELAVDLNGFRTGGFSYLFSTNPNIQLNYWPGNDQGDSTPHYGASYLFMKYLFDRFGEEFIHELVSEPEDGMRGLDATLSMISDNDDEPLFTSETIFQDWTVANILQAEAIENGIYQYGNDEIPLFLPTSSIVCGSPPEKFSASQFGTNYIEIECDGDYEISIKWEENVQLHSENAFSGNYSFWSNSGDESAMRLTKEFDFSEVTGLVELSFNTWFDIEQDYDYLYVNASRDGENWDNLETPDCTKDDPTGSNLGCGYNGRSNGWIEQTIDLSSYAGKMVFLEFEYVTDAAVNGEGFFLDDVKVEAVDFFDDFEEFNNEWIPEGFVRIDNAIPQIMGVTIISPDQEFDIHKFILTERTEFTFTVQQDERNQADVAVINGLSRYTNIPAQYQVSVAQLD
jgi:immune inhibitor A